MKKLVLICAILCSCFLMATPAVQAAKETSEYFTVNVSYAAFTCINPGDTFTETFTVENTTDQTIKVRLHDVENVDNSVLYSVLTASWVEDGSETALGSFDDLVAGPNTEWHILDPGEIWTLDLDMHFPEECGNAYQGTTLVANFIFETRIPDEGSLPETGDGSDLHLWMILAVISGSLILLLLWIQKRKTNKSTFKGVCQPQAPLINTRGGDCIGRD